MTESRGTMTNTAITHYALVPCGDSEPHAPHDYGHSSGHSSCPGVSSRDGARWALCSAVYDRHPAVRVLGSNDGAVREYQRW